jgi:hypothetical protein
MTRIIALAAVFCATIAFQAVADDKKIIVEPPGPATSTIIVEKVPEAKPDAISKQPDVKSAAANSVVATPMPQNVGISLSEQEAKTWIDKPVYSSDGKNIGEVVDFQRGSDKTVIGLHADIGGFLGFGKTRVSLTSAHFKLQTDRIVLDMTAAEAKALPKIQS